MTDENSTDLLQSDQQSQSTSDQQLGWNCFDIAIDLAGKLNITSSDPTERAKQARKVLIEEAVDKASDSDYRELLAPEIRNAAALTVAAMNADNLESNDRNLLPSDMRTRELQNLYNDYNQVLDSDVVKEAIENCNVEFGFSAENRKNINELKEWFQDEINRVAYSQAYECYEQAENAIKEATGNFDNYCLREEVYRQYLQQYYGRNEWFAFQPDFSTSMVDVTAKLLNIQISIYNNDRNVIHQTGNYGSSVSVNFNQNHFTAMPDAIQSMEISEITEQPTTSKRKASLDDSNSPIILKKMDILPKTNDTFSASGVKHSLHGVAYQWKILMMLAKQCQKYGYSFRLATEKDDADKFDDAVLLYKISARTNIINYIFLQAKHIQEESASKQAIKENDLLTETDDKFSLQKYFISFQKIKRNYEFEEGCQKYFVIYTNIGFGFDSYSDHPGLNKLSSLYFKSIANPNELLNIENEGNCYQLDIESEPETVRRLKEIFEKTSDCQKLTNDLVECILNEKSIGLDGQIKNNHKFLVKYVFDLENNKFNKDFINGEIDGDLSDDINGFRDVLLEKIREYLEEKPPKERTKQEKKILTKLSSKPQKKKRKLTPGKSVGLWSVFEELDLEFSPGFRNITIFEPIPQIEDPTGVAENIFRLVNRHKDSDKAINVQRGDARGNQILISELNNLAGHILVKKIKGGKEYAGFSDKFLNDNNEELPGNISELREELMQAFEVTNKADLKGKIDAYVFNISKFEPCKETDFESLLNAEIFVPAPNITEEEIEEFLNHLIFMVNQPHERELSVLIGKELGEEFNLIDDNLITSNFQDKIVNWLKEKAGTYITENEMQNFFDAMSSAISQFVMIGPTSEYTKKLDEYGLVFANLNRKLTEFLNQFEDSPNIFNFVTPKGETMLGSIEVSQILRGIAEYKQEDSYILVRLSTFIRLDERIILAFKKKQAKLLIIECNLEKQRIENLGVGGLLDSLSGNKKLLLISSKDNGLINEFKKGNITLKGKFEEMEYKMKFLDLNKESQDRILESKIDFQGNSVDLHKIVSADSALIELLSLVDLLKGKQIKIGEAIPITYGYDPDYYIDRTFNLNITITDKKIYPTDTTNNLQQLLDEAKRRKLMIIADTTGMGKSTVLTHLSRKIKELNPNYWVVRINLNDHTDILKIMQEKDVNFTRKTAISFIIDELLNLKVGLERDLFEHLLKEKKIVLMLDGFDEISPNYTNVVLELLKGLKQTSLEQLWVATRPYLKDNLEEALQQVSCTLQAFSEDDQVEFLTKFWKKSLKLSKIVESKLQSYARALVKKLSASINDKDKEFTGVPLQTHMLAEAFSDEFKEFYYSEELKDNLPDKLDLLELYDKFLNRKYLIYVSEKNNPNIINVATEDLIHILKGGLNLRKVYQHLAIKSIFPQQGELLLKGLKSRDIPQAKLSRIGIAQLNGKPKFVHRSFSEYYAADFFVYQLNRKTHSDDLKDFLLKNIFLKIDYEVIRNFIDGLLVKDTPAEYLIKEYGQRIDEFYKSGSIKDSLGSILHVAVREGNPNITNFIFSSLKIGNYANRIIELFTDKTNQTDSLNIWHIATWNNNSKILNVILKWTEEIGLNLQGFHKILFSVGKNGLTIWHPACYNNYTDILKILFRLADEKLDGKDFKRLLLIGDKFGQTPWGLSALKNPDIFRMLLEIAELKLTRIEFKELLLSKCGSDDTIWHRVANEGYLNVLKWLLIWAQDNLNSEDIKKVLLKKNNSIWPYIICCCSEDIQETLRKLCEERGLNYKDDIFATTTKYGETSWHLSANLGKAQILDKLWNLSKQLNFPKNHFLQVKSNHELTVWHFGVMHGDISVLKKLLEITEETNLNLKDILFDRDQNGESVWYKVADCKKVDVLDWLLKLFKIAQLTPLESKMLLLEKNRNGETLWFEAIIEGRIEILEKLLEFDELLNLKNDILLSKNKDGKTAWYKAASDGKISAFQWALNLDQNLFLTPEELKLFLLEADNYGETPWHNASKYHHIDALNKLLELSIQLKLDLNSILLNKNHEGKTPWHNAVNVRTVEILEWFWKLSKSIPLSPKELERILLTPDNNGDTIWLLAANSYSATLKIFWKFSQEIGLSPKDFFTSKNNIGKSAWHISARYGMTTTLEELFEFAEMELTTDELRKILSDKDDNGQSVWHLAVHSANIDVLETLLKLCKERGIYLKDELLVKDNKGRNILHQAAKKGYINSLEQIWNNISPHKNLMEIRDDYGRTALHLAAREGEIETAKFLLENGANVFAKNDHDTILHQAIFGGNISLIKLILETPQIQSSFVEKFDALNATDLEGDTPLMWAIENGKREIVEVLLGIKEIDVSIKNGKGMTALDWALDGKYWDIVPMLLNIGADIGDLDVEKCALLKQSVEEENDKNKERFLEKIEKRLVFLEEEMLVPMEIDE